MLMDKRFDRRESSRGGRRISISLLCLGLIAIGLLIGWSAKTLFGLPAPLPHGAEYSTISVDHGELSREIRLNASVGWFGGEYLVNQATGTLTERQFENGSQVMPGDVLYTVDLEPVAVAVGSVPAFRDLEVGSEGADVRQLQEMLIASGFRTEPADGRFGSGTRSELEEWQSASGVSVTGAVPLGSLLFVRNLPGVVGWSDDSSIGGETIAEGKGMVGADLAPGDRIAQFLPSAPSFTIDLPVGQRRLVSEGSLVALEFGQYSWQAVIESIAAPREDGSAVATLASVSLGQSICGQECNIIPLEGSGSVVATITVLAPIAGTIVPTAALVVAPDGATTVVDQRGGTVPVEVVAIVGGQAAVEGLSAGTTIRVPGVKDSE